MRGRGSNASASPATMEEAELKSTTSELHLARIGRPFTSVKPRNLLQSSTFTDLSDNVTTLNMIIIVKWYFLSLCYFSDDSSYE